jgi:hypothetical protein
LPQFQFFYYTEPHVIELWKSKHTAHYSQDSTILS